MRPPHYPRGPRRAAPDGCPPRDPRVRPPGSLPGVLVRGPSRHPPRAAAHVPPRGPTSLTWCPVSPPWCARPQPAARPVRGSLAASQPAARSPAPPRATAHARPPLFLLSPAPPAPPRFWGTGPSCVSPDRARRGAARPLGADRAVIGSSPAPAPPRPRPSAPGAGEGVGGLVNPARAVPRPPLGPPISPPLRAPVGTDWAPRQGGARLPGGESPVIGSLRPGRRGGPLPFVCFRCGGEGEGGGGGGGASSGTVWEEG